MKICLDAGHYGYYNQSPANKSYYESKMVWKLHLKLKKCLESYGVQVITTRPEQEKNLALFDRGAKAAGCDLFLSLHSNAVGSGVNNKIDYVVAYAAINRLADPIAEKLVNRIAEVMGTSQSPRIEHRKGNNGDYYGVVRGATAVGVPGTILEHSFHTNRKMTDWLLEDSNLDKLARAEAEVIAEHYGLSGGSEPVPPAERWYRIRKIWEDAGSQIGAYENLNNAKKACLAGYTVFDWNGKAVYSKGGEAYPYVGKCTGNGVNVRKGPGMGYGNIVRYPKLNKGNLVDVLGKEGTWYKIRIDGKYEGYISEDYLQRV